MELTKEEKMVILKIREDKKLQEDSEKIVKVGILKHDISNGYYIASDFCNLFSGESSGESFLTREQLAKQIKKIDKIFNQYRIKKGTQFYCTRSEYGEFWGESKFYFNFDTKWAEENLENIRDY
jgi:hypothetical protein